LPGCVETNAAWLDNGHPAKLFSLYTAKDPPNVTVSSSKNQALGLSTTFQLDAFLLDTTTTHVE